MTDQFASFEQALDGDPRKVAEQAIATGRQLAHDFSDLCVRLRFAELKVEAQDGEIMNLRRLLCEERLERHKLKVFLREALRHWIQNTRDVEDAVAVWRMSRQAGLGQ